ncbi:hypothetical protein [Streptomyces yangpuensis]|uniref:hypothetical protein n=1 Tax=Streptomyces yangpuensis TaxID=1648182 RepID=UPI0035DFD304
MPANASKRARTNPGREGKPRKKEPDWILGAVPQDALSPVGFRPEPKGAEARNIPDLERLAFLVANPALYEVAAEVFPRKTSGNAGRPAHYPPYIYLIFVAAISIFSSARSVEANFRLGSVWKIVVEGVRHCLGDKEADLLPETGPERHHWMDFQPKMIRALPRLREISRDTWIRQAIAQGLLSEKRPRGNWLRPDRSQVINGDGTVVRPPSDQTEEFSVDKRTGEIRRHRVDPDAGIQTEGDGNSIYGKKLVAFSTRVAGKPHSRWFLNVDSARHRSPEEDPDREEEASVALRLAHEIIDRAPGVIAASFDTAWRGVHRTGLVRRGIIVFTRQHDGIKPHPLERFRYQDCTHDIYATAGRACERQITVNGKTMYSPLPVRELEVRSGNTWRFYHRVEIPCRHGAHTERIPVYETQKDQRIDPRTKRKKFNRTEHLRQVPPNTDYGDRLLGFRQDSESGNCTLDYSHRDNRVPAYGAQAALLVYLGFAWMINSISLATAASPSA